MTAFVLTPEREKQVEEILARYPNRQAALIPVLHLCQEQHGWIAPEIVEWAAQRFGVSDDQVTVVVTFY